MTQPLINIEMAKRHLRIEITEDDQRVVEKMNQASSIVLDYLKTDSVPVDGPIEAATLLVLEALFDGSAEPLSQPVKDLLHRKRDPAFA